MMTVTVTRSMAKDGQVYVFAYVTEGQLNSCRACCSMID